MQSPPTRNGAGERPDGPPVLGRIFVPIHSGNTFEEIVDRVMAAIRLGAVSPGEQLPTERELASALGVSRVTLREAMRSLQEAGYVESRRGRGGGTFVVRRPASSTATGDPRKLRRLSREEAEDLIELRRILEVGAAELAARRPHDDDTVQSLMTLVRQCAASPLADYRPIDSRLHLAVAELAEVPSLTTAIATARSRANDLLDAIPLLPPNIDHSNRQHVALVEAILRGDADAAREAMSEHLHATATLLRAFLV